MKDKIIILLMIGVVALIVPDLTKLVRQFLTAPKPSSSTVIASPNPSPSTTTISQINTTIPHDWKTYSNPNYHFSFQYPSDYTFYREEILKSGKLSVDFRIKDYGKDLGDGFKVRGGIQVLLDRTSLSLENYIKKDLGVNNLNYGQHLFGTYSTDESSRLYVLDEIGQRIINEKTFIYYLYAGAAGGDQSYVTKSDFSEVVASLEANYDTLIPDQYINPILASFKFEK